jgi:hypothetical protein
MWEEKETFEPRSKPEELMITPKPLLVFKWITDLNALQLQLFLMRKAVQINVSTFQQNLEGTYVHTYGTYFSSNPEKEEHPI